MGSSRHRKAFPDTPESALLALTKSARVTSTPAGSCALDSAQKRSENPWRVKLVSCVVESAVSAFDAAVVGRALVESDLELGELAQKLAPSGRFAMPWLPAASAANNRTLARSG